jgi:Cu2+-exporting ATPase
MAEFPGRVERLDSVHTILFGESGTLTLPEPEVIDAADIPPEQFALTGRLARAVARATGATEPLAAMEEPSRARRVRGRGAAARSALVL